MSKSVSTSRSLTAFLRGSIPAAPPSFSSVALMAASILSSETFSSFPQIKIV
jgi:hypothetical protein